LKKRIGVVGAGVAGLNVAIHLQKDGYDVTIYEAQEKIGGKMNQIKKDGFSFDVGPTIVMLPHIYKEPFEYSGVDHTKYFKLLKLKDMYDVHFPDGEVLTPSNDLVNIVEDMESRSSDTSIGFLEYLTDTYKKYQIVNKHFLTKTYTKASDFYNIRSLVNAVKLRTFRSAHNAVASFVKDEKIQKLLAFQTLYIGISPKSGPSIYAIIPMIETIYGVWYIKGGMYSYANALGTLFKELGGSIKLNSKVDEITFENGVATGIIVDSKKHSFDKVIVNADFPYAMKHLVKNRKAKGKYSDKKIDGMKYSSSVVIFYLGLKTKLSHLNVHNLYFSHDFDAYLKDIFDGTYPKDPSFYIYSPSQIDENVAPEGMENIYVLIPVSEKKTAQYKWNLETLNQFRDEMFERLEKRAKIRNIKELIVTEDMYTPDRFETEQFSLFGSAFGLAPTLLQSIYFRPRNIHPYAHNLYFVGASVHPGAGVPIAMMSGTLVHKHITKIEK
jgi:phytoene desaturase